MLCVIRLSTSRSPEVWPCRRPCGARRKWLWLTFRDDSDGVIRGKAALRAYWAEGLRHIPDLHFEVVAVYVGVHTLVINYRNQLGRLVNEVLIFDGSLVAQGHGTYLGSGANPAGVTCR